MRDRGRKLEPRATSRRSVTDDGTMVSRAALSSCCCWLWREPKIRDGRGAGYRERGLTESGRRLVGGNCGVGCVRERDGERERGRGKRKFDFLFLFLLLLFLFLRLTLVVAVKGITSAQMKPNHFFRPKFFSIVVLKKYNQNFVGA